MGTRPYDLAIYAPGSAPMYVADAQTVGGAERQMVILAQALASHGWRVCHVVAHMEGLPHHRDSVDLIAEAPVQSGVLPGMMLRRIFGALRRADAHVYLQRSAGFATLATGAFARSYGRRFIYSTSSSMDLTFALPLAWQEALGFRLGLPLADAVVVQTHEQARAAGNRHNITHIPSLCEPASIAGHTERDAFIWVGRPASYKNPLAFIELARAVPEGRFLMVGIDGSHSAGSEIAAAADSLSNLELLPPLPRSAVLPLYERAVAVVNTSDFEGFPNAFLEGWARGALALSLSVDPDDIITTHDIGTVAGGSAGALADAGRAMWHRRDRLDEERKRAVRYVTEHHAPDEVAAHWSALLETLVTAGERWRKRRPATSV